MDETPEQKAAREADEKHQRELDARIVAGVTAGLKPVIEKLSEREQPVVQRTESVSTISRPTEEQLADALIDGNKAEYARLLKLTRAADQQENQRTLANITSQGGAAINAVTQATVLQDPIYKKYKKEVDAEIAKFRNANPSVILTPEHYGIVMKMVRADHFDDEKNEWLEETRRSAREAEEALLPNNSHVEQKEEKEPTSLVEALDVPDWKLFKEKQRGVGGRTEDEELRKMGFKKGLPDFLSTRKEVARIEEEVGSGMGLDRDWVWTDKAKNEGHWVN